MMSELITESGVVVSESNIERAVSERRAVIRWCHNLNFSNSAGLEIYPDAETAAVEADRDTRGDCYSMADEVWSELATDVNRAIRAAAGKLIER
jgi:hypothetical protein